CPSRWNPPPPTWLACSTSWDASRTPRATPNLPSKRPGALPRAGAALPLAPGTWKMPDFRNANPRFQRADERLLIALASVSSVRPDARPVRLYQDTVRRRLADPEFRKRLSEVRSRMLDRAIGKLAATVVAASTTLRKLLQAQSETVRLGAARSILELHCRL